MEKVTIRRETDADIPAIDDIITTAFAGVEHSDQTEAEIVRRLRDADALSVSLVAVVDGEIVGHVAVSPVAIEDGTGGWFGLGPIAVAPDIQGKGIGSLLMNEALAALERGEAGGVVVLGDPDYYQRFGFVQTEQLTYPGPPPEYFRARKITDSRFPSGVVQYHAAFG